MMKIRWAHQRGHLVDHISPCQQKASVFLLGTGGLDASHWEGPTPQAGVSEWYQGRLSVEFVNVGGWLSNGDVALDSCAQFPAV